MVNEEELYQKLRKKMLVAQEQGIQFASRHFGVEFNYETRLFELEADHCCAIGAFLLGVSEPMDYAGILASAAFHLGLPISQVWSVAYGFDANNCGSPDIPEYRVGLRLREEFLTCTD